MTMLSRRNLALILVLILLLATFILYAPTVGSMVSVWFGSNSFLHGILILPMSAYMIWHKRAQWIRVPVRPALTGILLLLASVLAWTIASLVSVQVVSQLAFIAMLGAATWSVLGTRTVYVLMFPLLYAFFAVPFGEFLVPTLMDWTASGTVLALQITGIPVLREGNYFSLPSGNFEVIEACSGIRFLLVTVVLGLFFAHETYKSWTKRGIFVALAAIAIIVANWVRAYLVVLTAHLTDMKFGSGQDHIYMGWAIFLLVIAVLFWLGRRFEDAHEEPADESPSSTTDAPDPDSGRRMDVALVSVIVFALLASGPILLDLGLGKMAGSLKPPLLPLASDGWSGPGAVTRGYRPVFAGASNDVAGSYRKGEQDLELHVVFYTEQQQGNELVGWQSKLFDANKWRLIRRGSETVSLSGSGEVVPAQTLLIGNGRQRLQLWYWYDIGGALTSGPRTAKIRQAWNLITGNRHGDALVVLVMPVDHLDTAFDTELLRAFVTDHLDGLKQCLRPGIDEHPFCASAAMQNRIPE